MKLELSDADFEAYAPERTRATTMTAPRGAVKRRLAAYGAELADRLGHEGVELQMIATDEHPSARNGHRVEAQSAYLFRTDAARKAMQLAIGGVVDATGPELGHARIEIRVDANAATLLVWIGGDARVDLEHAAAVLAHPSEELLAIWETIPESIVIEARATLSARARVLGAMSPMEAAVIAKSALESEVPVVIGIRTPRANATKENALDHWADAAMVLGRLLHAIAWSPDSAARIGERPSRRNRRRAPKEITPALREPSSESAVVDRGARVRALTGAFAGQVGVVQELDAKGGVRVLFGLLVVRVELADLALAGAKRGRPTLSSSHRKPST